MTKFELERLRDLPIEGVAERLGLNVENHKCLCPFHDDHRASLRFKNNKYKCWSCGESGDNIDLVMKYLNKDFKEACRWLSPLPSFCPPSLSLPNCSAINGQLPKGEASSNLSSSPRGEVRRGLFDASRYARFFERPFLNAEARHFLFEERRLDERVVRWCRLTSWRDRKGVPWLQIPYYNREGKLIGIQNRNLVKGALPRFKFPQGSQCGIYNLPVLNRLKAGDELYIAEGCSDCWSLLSAGHKAIAIPSATLLTRENMKLLSELSSSHRGEDGRGLFHMYPDKDTPGERLFLQLQKVLPSLVHHQLPPDCKDYSDLFVKMKK